MASTTQQNGHVEQYQCARDFRSDTLTAPTASMFEAMMNASRGDDVYGEDASTNALQDRVAKLTGKSAALFVSTGTLSNQLAIRTHLQQPPYSVLCDIRAHIHRYEAGGIAFHSQAQTHAIQPENGHHLVLEDDILPNLVEGEDVHEAPTRLVCLENTLSGMVFPQDEVLRISEVMKERGVILHCDGARIWEVCAKTGLSLQEFCAPYDSVSLCLSKGLGAPIGSILVGSKAFITKARWFRKLFGGGTRQCGSLAAAAEWCIDEVFPQLPRVHSLAARLADGFARLGARLLLPAETNMVFLDTTPLGYPLSDLSKAAAALSKPIKITQGGEAGGRLVVHWQTDPSAIDDLLELAGKLKTTDVQPDEISLKHAKGEMADAEVVKDSSRSGRLRQKQKPAYTQSSPYRASSST